MKRGLPILLGVVMFLSLGSTELLAHHAFYSTYDRDKTIKIEGTLKEFLWRNPHSFMKVEAPDENGERQTWVIEGAAAAVFAEQGVTTNTLRPGDHVIVTGVPGRIAEDHRLLLQTVERPSDGFKYQGPAAALQ